MKGSVDWLPYPRAITIKLQDKIYFSVVFFICFHHQSVLKLPPSYCFDCGFSPQAIWFTENRGSQSDDPNTNVVFGAADKWNGIGVFLDSFDNDGQVSFFALTFH